MEEVKFMMHIQNFVKKNIPVILLLCGIFFGMLLVVYRFGGYKGFQSVLVGNVGKVAISMSSNKEFLNSVMGFDRPKTYVLVVFDTTVLTPFGGIPRMYVIMRIVNGIPSIVRIEPVIHFDQNLLDKTDGPKNFDTFATQVMEIVPNTFTDVDSVDAVIGGTKSGVIDFLKLSKTSESEQSIEIVERIVGEGQSDNLEQRVRINEVIEQVFGEARKHLLTQAHEYVALLKRLIIERHIVVLSRDPETNKVFRSKGLAEERHTNEHNFVSVIHTELSDGKTNVKIQKYVRYEISPFDSRHVVGNISIQYIYPFDTLGTPYVAKVSIHIPPGSKGESKNVFLCLDNEETHDVLCEGDVVVKPHEKKEISIAFLLPQSLADEMARGTYTLFVKKQFGAPPFDFDIHVESKKPLSGCTPFSDVVEFRNTYCDMRASIVADTTFTVLLQ